MIKHIKTQEEFKNAIKTGRVIADFYADWCGPCQMLAPNLEELSKQIDVLKIDTDELRDLAISYGVMSLPTLILFENGEIVNQHIGFLDLKGLEKLCKVSN